MPLQLAVAPLLSSPHLIYLRLALPMALPARSTIKCTALVRTYYYDLHFNTHGNDS